MSIVADFAYSIHEKNYRESTRALTPLAYPSLASKLFDMRVVIFDVYGTLINYWRSEFSDPEQKERFLLAAFKKTIDYFGFSEFLLKMDSNTAPEKILKEFYLGLIALNHEKKINRGIAFPEVKIEEIWAIILKMLERHGYRGADKGFGDVTDLSRCVAYYYNFFALSGSLYEGVVDALLALKGNNIKLGIVSNAQFYTPIDLTFLIRKQSRGKITDFYELFDIDLTFLSYEYGVSKPNPMMFRALYDALYEMQLLPGQTVFVGNDLSSDIKPAADAGMKTAFFTGDSLSAFTHDCMGSVVPDIVFDSWASLPEMVSFFEEKGAKQE